MEKELTFEQICKTIDLTAPTMDNYMYAYHFEQDYYHISVPALDRFRIPSASFHNVVETLRTFVYPNDFERLQKELDEIQTSDCCEHNLQYRWMSKDGAPIWISCRGTVIRQNGKPLYMMGCVNEIGERPKADNLSGLLRLNSLSEIFKRIIPGKETGFLLRLGIDDLRGINARLGIEYGDLAVQQTAECIQDSLEPGQEVYRIQGDEFLVTDYSKGTYTDAVNLFRRIRRRIDACMQQNHYEVLFTVSGGILMCEDIEDNSYSTIMKWSEFSLAQAKNKGVSTYARYSTEAYMLSLRKRDLLVSLRQAVYNNFEGFQAYFQPLFQPNGSLIGAESLMRFSSEEYGAVSPAEFIPILEESGLIIPAGKWIMRQAMALCKKFQSVIPGFKVSFNVSYIQFLNGNICEEILKTIKEFDLTPETVVVELTESGLLESNHHFSKKWKLLKENGVQMALDDFGTGYSNFHYLNELHPHIIKIDRSFTVSAMQNHEEYALLGILRQLAATLHLSFCIEGIETPEEFFQMSQLHPDYCQGYYFGKPCPSIAFIEQFANVNV